MHLKNFTRQRIKKASKKVEKSLLIKATEEFSRLTKKSNEI
jgi:hypothetical protein